MSNSVNRGVIFALITAFISGFAIFFSKIAVKVADPIVHVSLRTLLVALVLSLMMNFQGKLSRLALLSKKEKLLLVLIGIIGGSVPFLLFFVGLSKTSATSAALIHKTLYIWVAILAISVLKEKVNFLQGVGYGLILLSNLTIGGWQGFTFGIGELMVFAATFLWAIENIIAKIALKTVDPVTVAWARLTIGSSIIFISALSLGKAPLMLTLTFGQFFTIVGGATTLFLYVIFWYKALSLAEATRVSSILVLSTLITNLLSAIFISYTLPSPQLIASLLTIAGVGAIVVLADKRLKVQREKLRLPVGK